MKKILVLSIAVIMSLLLLAGCTGGEADRNAELEMALDETYTQLTDTFSDSGSKFMMIEEYIGSWAKTNKVKVVETAEHYMVLRNGPTENGGDAEAVTLFCPVDTADMTDSSHGLSAGLAALLGPSEHGRIDLIVAESDADGYEGASSLPGKYLNAPNFIDLDTLGESGLKTSGSYAFDASLYKKVKYEDVQYEHAYEISMSLSSYKDLFDYSNNCPNPVEVIGNYLAAGRSGGYLFQLASFECTVSDTGTPVSAKAVIIIDDNNISKMEKRFSKSYEGTQKKCDKLGIDFVYTMAETDLPEKALKDSDASKIISLLYTLDPGVFYQDEDSGEIIASNEFSEISLTDKKFTLKETARSKTKESLSDMRQAIITLVGLSDLKYKLSDTYITWSASEELSSYFIQARKVKDSESTTTIKTSDLNILSAKKSGLNCIYYGYHDGDDKAALTALTGFIESLAAPEEQ